MKNKHANKIIKFAAMIKCGHPERPIFHILKVAINCYKLITSSISEDDIFFRNMPSISFIMGTT